MSTQQLLLGDGEIGETDDANRDADDRDLGHGAQTRTHSNCTNSDQPSVADRPRPPRLQLLLLFVCGIGTFARTEVFVLQTRFFTKCGGYGTDYFPFSHAALFIPPIFFLYVEVRLPTPSPLLVVVNCVLSHPYLLVS